MGNTQDSHNPFYATSGGKDSELAQLLTQFAFVSIYEDQLFGRCSVIEHKQSKELIITKDVLCQNQREMNKLHQDFQRRKSNLVSPNLVRLRYSIKKKTEGLFSDQYKLVLFFDYVVTSLFKEYRNRVNAQKYFTNEEINVLICGALRGYAALEDQNIANNKVRLNNVYFGLAGGLQLPKVIDSKLFPTSTNIMAIHKGEKYDDVFLAPQELRNMGSDASVCYKAGVWSLAVSMIQLCLLSPCLNVYDYAKKSINYNQLDNRLNIVKNKYPLSVYVLLRDMLERSDDSRPSFKKLAQSLPSNMKNLPTTMNISFMKNDTRLLSGNTAFPTGSKFMGHSQGFSKVLNPINNSKYTKRMSGTLVSEYRPVIETSEIYTNGNKYEGQKKETLRHGKGKYAYNDGSYYFGDWVKGKMEGQGELIDPEGNLLYEGSWKDDHYQGKGRLMGRGSDWTKYQGEFRGGRMEGFGEMWFYDGRRFKGQFRNDLPHGKGRMFMNNSQIQNGMWEKGNFVSQF